MDNRKLFRSKDQVIGGVCAGIAKYLNVDVSLVRIITFLAIFMGGVSFWLYVLAWVIIPVEPKWQGMDARVGRNVPEDVVVLEDEYTSNQEQQKPPKKSNHLEDKGPEW